MFGPNSPGLTEYFRKKAAWEKASSVTGRDPNFVRVDDYGSTIYWDEYGNRNSAFGWEIDHKLPSALGGSDSVGNLRALHWRNNAALGGQLAALMR